MTDEDEDTTTKLQNKLGMSCAKLRSALDGYLYPPTHWLHQILFQKSQTKICKYDTFFWVTTFFLDQDFFLIKIFQRPNTFLQQFVCT